MKYRAWNPLLACAGALVVVCAPFSAVSFADLWPEHHAWQDLGLVAGLGSRLTTRDWAVGIAVLAFAALNMFLWTLPITQTHLFLITLPAGLVAMIVFVLFAGGD